MSMFYGQVKGSAESIATRRGSKSSGIRASVQSWDASVITDMQYVPCEGLRVSVEISDDSSFSGKVFFDGTIDELKEKLR